MGRNLLDLAASLRRKVRDADAIGNAVKQQTAIAILQQLVVVTPVDTSQALSNWQIGVGAPVAAPIRAYAYGRKGSTEAFSAQQALSVGTEKIMKARPGEPIFVSNVLHYIADLNRGTSLQAPRGFVQIAEMVGRAKVRQLGRRPA